MNYMRTGLFDNFHIRSRSTEQQEMERIEALQSEVAEHRRRNEASYKAALAGSEYYVFFTYATYQNVSMGRGT